MTAETLKPFLNSSPSVSNCVPATTTTKQKILIFGLAVSCFALTSTLIGITIWNSVRTSKLENDVILLNKVIDGMQKKLGLDYFDELSEFESSFKNDLLEDSKEEDSTEDDGGPLLDSFDSKNEDYDGDEDDEEDIDEDDFEGSAIYDDDDDAGDYDENNEDKLLDDFQKFKESKDKKRKTRAISEINGIPVFRESYAIRRNRTGGPEDENISRHLLNRNQSPQLRYDWGDKVPRPHLQVPRTTEANYLEARAAAPTIIRVDPNSQNTVYHQPQSKNPHHRAGYVYHQHSNNARPISKGPSRSVVKSHKKWLDRPGILAIHYSLNRLYTKENFVSNKDDPRYLQTGDDLYVASPHPWAKNYRMDEAFPVQNGFITIKEPGVYLIYSQIYYHNKNERNGFLIYHNSRAFLQCSLTVPENLEKGNTCYTSGVSYLAKGDTIHLRDIFKDHPAIFGNAKSFLGLVRLGNAEYYQLKESH